MGDDVNDLPLLARSGALGLPRRRAARGPGRRPPRHRRARRPRRGAGAVRPAPAGEGADSVADRPVRIGRRAWPAWRGRGAGRPGAAGPSRFAKSALGADVGGRRPVLAPPPCPSRCASGSSGASAPCLVRTALRLLALLPLAPALALGALVGRLAFHLAGRTRRLALRSLAQAFPERTEAERWALARQAFVELGRSALELAAIRAYDARLERYVELRRPRCSRTVIARGKGMVFVTGHLGNWELLARRIARAGIPNAVIAKAGVDHGLNELAEQFRASGGVATLWRESSDTGRAIIRTFRQGKALGILIDQDTRVQGVFVPFFGRQAFTPRAAADLALRFGAPVVVGTIHRRGPRPGDGHRVEVDRAPVRGRAAGPARRRRSGSPRPAPPSSRKPSGATRPSGSGCTSDGRPRPSGGFHPETPKQRRCRKALSFPAASGRVCLARSVPIDWTGKECYVSAALDAGDGPSGRGARRRGPAGLRPGQADGGSRGGA